MKKYIPWQLKIVSKIFLSNFPVGYKLWRRLGLFKHGNMIDPKYSYGVFKLHYDRVEFPSKDKEFVCLELGCGDSVSSALIANVFNTSKCYMVDTGRYATENMNDYLLFVEFLRTKGKKIAFDRNQSFDAMLNSCNGEYLTNGLNSLRNIPDASIDFIWSQAVLEHICFDEFSATMKELRRILTNNGVMSHRVDLRDHLGGALNNLRFSHAVWESDWMSKSGFYTNRIRFSEMINVFKDAGFAVDVLNIDRWNEIPTPKVLMNEEFSQLDNKELSVQGFDAILIPIK